MLRVTQPVKTDRLLLRPFQLDDLDALHDIESRPEVALYEYWGPRTREESAEALSRKAAQNGTAAEGEWLGLVICLADTGELIGDVSLKWASEKWRQGELGYVLSPDHQGRGYATEAAKAVLRLGFHEFALRRIQAGADARNTASIKVMERLGMRREAHFRGCAFVKDEWCDEVIYALLDTEFRP
ncbi:GNAT family protein [Fodinicola feengrottensis]|uniref:GNAT family protein n=1 Tax=Fodinicola feengrottensis TaxID=435914 RepID=A0ABN2GP67_9ACTN